MLRQVIYKLGVGNARLSPHAAWQVKIINLKGAQANLTRSCIGLVSTEQEPEFDRC